MRQDETTSSSICSNDPVKNSRADHANDATAAGDHPQRIHSASNRPLRTMTMAMNNRCFSDEQIDAMAAAIAELA